MTILLFLSALSLSGVAAFYSIAGLMAIFAAAPISIAVMGAILEASKLVVASWLYRNWNEVPILMKAYFVSALMILMFLTSMGIFGYLSKAHVEQGVPLGDVAAKVALIDDQINIEKEKIDAARKALNQLDVQIDRYTELGAITKGVNVRNQQQAEREQHVQQIAESQSTITRLREERSPHASQIREIEAEVGPIKYIAALIYGDEASQSPSFYEKAVRWISILIVVVFDPLAVVMLIAANRSLIQSRQSNDLVENDTPEPQPSHTEEEIEVMLDKAIQDIVDDTPSAESPSHPPRILPNPTIESKTWRSRPHK